MPKRLSVLLLAAVAVVATATAGVARTREKNAETVVWRAARAPLTRGDTAALIRLLAAVRGVDPLLCELATRSVDMHGFWSHWGPLRGNPLEVDSAAAALLRWLQDDHTDPAVVPRLQGAMRDGDACVRRVAGSFLGRVDHARATAALLAALEDPNAETRLVAAIGLGLSEKPAALQPLIARLRDDSPAVRRVVAWALGSLEEQAAVLPLIALLERDSDPRVRQAAAWAIGNILG
jgi:HEAT repeat protein